MEEVGAQIAHPIFIHQSLPGRFCEAPTMARKRDLPWQNPNFLQQQQQQQQQQQYQQRFQNPKGNWNPNGWDWDRVMFIAKPSEAEVMQMGPAAAAVVEHEQKNKVGETLNPLVMKKSAVDEDGENLTLKLGGNLYSTEENTPRPNKRVRSGSPGGGGGSYPMCQVDDCKGDLSNAKDYHRRHKVCEVHSKTTKALVGKQMQRFCQQCSRFHPLSEFDEGKRSCRRRLAGHNRRRRKTQPEDVSSRLVLPGNQDNPSNGNLDVVNLLAALARLQGNNVEKAIPDKDRLIQILSKIASPPVASNSASRSPVPGGFDLNVSQEVSSEHQNKMNGIASGPSTMDLLAVLSTLAGSSPDALAFLSQRSSLSSDDKTKLNCLDKAAGFNLQKKPVPGFSSVGGERSSTSYQSPVEVSDGHVQVARPNLPLQLFSSSPDDDSPPKMGSAWKYFSSDSSNPMESPSSSPPVVQKLFPMQTASEIMKRERMSISGEDNGTVEVSTTRGWNSPLELFKGPNGRVENSSVQNLPYQGGYASSSGSDHSPSSSNSDAQNRTGRIIFKLFDKDPSNFPGTLRTQILEWLSHSPSEMEGYIRPGCVVLSIYISMPSTAWEQLQEDLFQRVNFLVQDLDPDFWRNGRFLVHTDRQLASYKDGKVRLCKSWRTWSAPEIMFVSPLAVVCGQETSLSLRGRNLSVPGTKIHCTYMGGYLSKEVLGSVGTVYDDTSTESFKFPGGFPKILGRCFIEVENGFKGNSFPVIIADAAICQELKLLESEFKEDARVGDIISEDQMQDLERPRSREDCLYFLNELGWLFQRKNTPYSDCPDFSHTRFKFLFTFSVERDWCTLIKTLLDILVERNMGKDGLLRDSLEMLSEIHLLNRAVKRKCRKMVDLLIHYSVSSSTDASKKYLFPPNQTGPGGVTPLHLAACTHDSKEMVDALTNDPQEIGLNCWNSLLDTSGQSPYAYASARNNHYYNRLVAQKLTDRKHGQVSISVMEGTSLDQSWIVAEESEKANPQRPKSQKPCGKCAIAATRYYKRMPGYQGLLHRPYVHSMLAIAAVCVCVCLFLRGSPDIGSVAPFKWENLHFGTS
ncbi:Transcription factor [Macleaya cordata]|uniref:Transcription factor n=1 Tax=Macleaya cordata TaxID=56857 RepID=A0A200PS46_MACCD|nr:Transcription factor [Macleaya cordata]